MSTDRPPLRRIVTGDDDKGRSRIIADGPTPAIKTIPGRPGYRVENVWATGASPSPVDDPDRIAAHLGVSPPPGGTVLRVIHIPPEPANPEERRRQALATFGQLFKDAHHNPDAKHPSMHKTDTIDYAIMLEGELVAILDDEETTMRAGDILIQRGTMHAWANRSGKIARIAFVLIDSKR